MQTVSQELLSTRPDISIVVPTYRGSKTIRTLFGRVRDSCKELALRYEVVFVFDDGPDNSWSIIKELVHENQGVVRGIKLNRNFGQHNATICGFKYAKGNFIVTLDEDLQHDPTDISALLTKQKENDYDVVYGKFQERKHSTFRNFTSSALNRLLRYGIPELHKDYSSFRLIKASVAKETLEMSNSYTFLDGYLMWLTRNVSSILIPHHNSEAGSSSYNLKKLIEHSINIFITFSNLPIRFITRLSAVLIVFSSTYGAYILIRKLLYNDLVSGFATFAVMSSFGLAIILFSLGVIGEYLYRINLKTTKRPNFRESEIL